MPVFLDKKSWLKEGFVLQVAPDQYLLGEGPFQECSQSKKGFYYPDFFLEKKSPWLIPKKTYILNSQQFIEFLQFTDAQDKSSFSLIKPVSFLEFQSIYYKIQKEIRDSKYQKMVPVFAEEWEGRFFNVLTFLKHFFSRKKYLHKNFYLYGCWSKEQGLLGLSPEILFSVKGSSFYTMALAGTAPNPGPSLLKDSKEMEEHRYVIQSLEDSLKKIVHWESILTSEKVFGRIKHLCTEKQGKLISSFHFEEIVKKMHPTAALGSYPKEIALTWLKKHQMDRNSFGAPVGYCQDSQRAFCLVGIRNVEWNASQIKIRSGAGIVKDSLLQKEWRELSIKREQVKNIFF